MGNGKKRSTTKGRARGDGKKGKERERILFPSFSLDHASLVNINRRLGDDWRQKSQGWPIKLLRFSIKNKL